MKANKEIETASLNSLEETLNCLHRIKYTIKDFLHIEDYLSNNFKNSLAEEIDRVNKELDLREGFE